MEKTIEKKIKKEAEADPNWRSQEDLEKTSEEMNKTTSKEDPHKIPQKIIQPHSRTPSQKRRLEDDGNQTPTQRRRTNPSNIHTNYPTDPPNQNLQITKPTQSLIQKFENKCATTPTTECAADTHKSSTKKTLQNRKPVRGKLS